MANDLYSDEPSLHVLELFHGPTLAFKDLGLQFIGSLFEYLLAKHNRKLSIIVATSGDTGTLIRVFNVFETMLTLLFCSFFQS